MTIARVRIVSDLTATRTTLAELSLTGSTGLYLGEGFEAPPPQLRRAVVDNPVKNGGTVAASAYGLRTVKLPVAVPTSISASDDTSAQARQAQITTLMRLLNQDTFWLEVSPTLTVTPRFLRCYRAADADLLADLNQKNGMVTVTCLAEPFAYGAQEVIGNIAINDAGFLAAEITNVKGDVPCPLILKWTFSGNSLTRPVMILGARSDKASWSPLVAADTALSSTISTTAGVADATAVGGTVRRIDFSASGQVSTVQGNVIAVRAGATVSGTQYLWGTYRAFLAVSQGGVNGNTHTIQVLNNQSQPVGAPIKVTRTSAALKLVDLGLFEFPPAGSQATDPLTGTPLAPGSNSQRMVMNITSDQGATLSYDVLILVPASESLLIWDSGQGSSLLNQQQVLDPFSGGILFTGAGDLSSTSNGTVTVNTSFAPSYVGDPPMLAPGSAINTLAGLQVDGLGYTFAAGVDALSSFVAGFYFPQYLTVV